MEDSVTTTISITTNSDTPVTTSASIDGMEGILTSPVNVCVLCKCGVKINDGYPMVQCISCDNWSHLSCYGLTEQSACEIEFTCLKCGIPAYQFPSSVDIVTLNDSGLAVKVSCSNTTSSILVPDETPSPCSCSSIDLPAFCTHVNSKLIQLSDKVSDLSGVVDRILYKSLVELTDKLLVVSQLQSNCASKDSVARKGQTSKFGHRSLPLQRSRFSDPQRSRRQPPPHCFSHAVLPDVNLDDIDLSVRAFISGLIDPTQFWFLLV